MDDDSAMRAAYVAGATMTFEAAFCFLPAVRVREIEDWLGELAQWTGGPPPVPPHLWE